MKMGAISGRNQNFGKAYVTLVKENLADVISQNVDTYNKVYFKKMYEESVSSAQKVIDNVNSTLENSNKKIRTVEDLVKKTDLFILAGGSGSRFKSMAHSVAKLRNKGELFNKISVPFELEGNHAPLTMLDIPLSMGRFFAGKNGYEKIVSKQAMGSFGAIINQYLNEAKEVKDVVVCCGDNVFDMKSEEMLDYIVRTINNHKKQLGVVGVARTPYEVANRFGILAVDKQDKKTGFYPLKDFIEKPKLEIAKKLMTSKGVCIANTGMFVIKKETMVKMLEEIKKNPKLITKTEQEKYDFANATKWARNVNGTSASDVLLVKIWEDVGEPQSYHNWVLQMKKGYFLSNFTPERCLAIYHAIQERVNDRCLQFSIKPNGSENIAGIKVIA